MQQTNQNVADAKAWENVCEDFSIGFDSTSGWTKRWQEVFKPIV